MKNRICPECGSPVAADAPAGMCPKCLLKVGLEVPQSESAAETIEGTVIVEPNSAATDEPVEQTQLDASGPADVPEIGTKVKYLGDYELLAEIARGGMGIVFRARQTRLNRTVALKMILAGQFADEADVERFHVEAEAAANLDHPGIVPIFEVGEHDNNHYFSMGLVEGESLSSMISDGPLPPRKAAQVVQKTAEAIQYAHDNGVIHRDLKPANVLIDQSGQPKVTDFGLARRLDGDSNLTGTGQVLGTPAYMPPEQAEGQSDEIGPLADVYSLGAILYCLITGRPPFQAAGPVETLRHVLEKEVVAPRHLNPDIPKDLDTICLKCLQKDQNHRYESAAELSAELERFMNGEPILARPVSTFERLIKYARRNQPSTALACIVMIGVSVLLFPLSTLDPRVLSAYAAVIASSSTWFWLAAVILLIFGVRQMMILAVFRAGRSVARKTTGSVDQPREPRKSPEEILWQTVLGLAIGAPIFCLLILIVQIIRLLQGEIL
ncbi:MAG: serine/threonine-protein kinase [Fuerstiella sp.]